MTEKTPETMDRLRCGIRELIHLADDMELALVGAILDNALHALPAEKEGSFPHT
jgi:hypothetical protein